MQTVLKYYISRYPAAIFLLLFLFTFSSFLPGRQSRDTVSFAFVSDTQSPLFFEKLWLKSDNNDKATAAIFSSLQKEPGISALFHLGDITAVGFMPYEWKGINRNFLELQKAGIAVYPELGNHEYILLPTEGKKQFFKTFTQLSSSWYVRRVGGVAIVLLNSNFTNLSNEETSSQQKWYENCIRQLDEDTAIKAIIVGTHYSPYTNSKVVSPTFEVQKYFVPVFLKSTKCRVFISGHSHAFEHFQNGGKDFIVTGGGGGLLHPLLTGQDQRYSDHFPYKTQRRMFHYIFCRQKEDALEIKIKMINPGYRTFGEVYELNIKLPK